MSECFRYQASAESETLAMATSLRGRLFKILASDQSNWQSPAVRARAL